MSKRQAAQARAAAPAKGKRKLTRAEKKQIESIIRQAKGDGKAHTAQQTIPYLQMYPDGICRVTDKKYSKSIAFEDINYQLAGSDDKTAIFENWCDFLNYFDASVSVQLSFINQGTQREEAEKAIDIPPQDDAFNSIRSEYAGMLKNQLSKGNNGLVKHKYITFSVEADNPAAAKSRLARIETDILNNFKVLGVTARPMNGQERLKVLHGVFHPDGEPFAFSYDWLAPAGLTTKDFIAPSSFRFGEGRYFRMGRKIGAVSFLEILAPELNDRMLADILDLETGVIVNLHIRSIDQTEAIKTIKRKITDLDKMKIEEQKKAVRSGYDMDIIPSDLATFGSEAKNLLQDLQSRNERMFLLTFLVVNMADTKRKLENDVFAAAGIAQKYNCALTRLDYQQEAGLMSSIPLGENLIPIQRGLTTSSTAIFIPFITQELFQTGEALYYGLNALSNNMILCDRKQLKNPNGLILGTPGCFTGDTKIRLSDGGELDFATLYARKQSVPLVSYDFVSESLTPSVGCDVRITKYTDRLVKVTLENGACISCTPEHRFLTELSGYVEAQGLKPGTRLVPQHTVKTVEPLELEKPVPVYDVTVEPFGNFMLGCGVIVHNSGKSFAAKREMTNAFLITDDDIIICDPEAEFTEAQGKAFYQVISVLKEQGYSCPKVHLLASYGLINYPELSGDYARIGIALYGVLSNRSDIQKCKIPLLPVLSIKVRIAAIKDLLCGEGVGYGLSYTATENRKIAILPIGYADGIPRALSCGNGNVLINGSIAPIIGRICMDQTIIDVTDIPTVKEGDIAIIIGKSGNAEITAYDIAEQTGTITNEILSRLGSRLDRFII